MPLLNAFKLHGDEARRALEPGENLLALSQATVAYGVTSGPSGAEPDTDGIRASVQRGVNRFDEATSKAEGNSKARKGVVRVLLAPLALFGAGPSADINFESVFGGRTCEGPGGSAARDVQQAVKKCSDAFVAVTDRRLLVLEQKTGKGMRIEWAVPRHVVTGARHRPRFLARGRFELRFVDGSWIMLSNWPPNIGSWHAKQVAGALISYR